MKPELSRLDTSRDPRQLALELVQAERKALVLNVLASRRGAANGMHLEEIICATLLSGRIVRRAIESLRLDGVHVCGLPETGYFIAETDEELDETIRWLTARAKKSLLQASRMRRIGIPALIGQMNLDD